MVEETMLDRSRHRQVRSSSRSTWYKPSFIPSVSRISSVFRSLIDSNLSSNSTLIELSVHSLLTDKRITGIMDKYYTTTSYLQTWLFSWHVFIGEIFFILCCVICVARVRVPASVSIWSFRVVSTPGATTTILRRQSQVLVFVVSVVTDKGNVTPFVADLTDDRRLIRGRSRCRCTSGLRRELGKVGWWKCRGCLPQASRFVSFQESLEFRDDMSLDVAVIVVAKASYEESSPSNAKSTSSSSSMMIPTSLTSSAFLEMTTRYWSAVSPPFLNVDSLYRNWSFRLLDFALNMFCRAHQTSCKDVYRQPEIGSREVVLRKAS